MTVKMSQCSFNVVFTCACGPKLPVCLVGHEGISRSLYLAEEAQRGVAENLLNEDCGETSPSGGLGQWGVCVRLWTSCELQGSYTHTYMHMYRYNHFVIWVTLINYHCVISRGFHTSQEAALCSFNLM